VKVTAVRMTYEHIAASWRRFTAERRAGLLGELELLPLQLPEVQSPDDRDRRSSPPSMPDLGGLGKPRKLMRHHPACR